VPPKHNKNLVLPAAETFHSYINELDDNFDQTKTSPTIASALPIPQSPPPPLPPSSTLPLAQPQAPRNHTKQQSIEIVPSPPPPPKPQTLPNYTKQVNIKRRNLNKKMSDTEAYKGS
jgi:hypothetical protein